MQPIRILLADDHAVLRDSLRAFLGIYPDMEVVGEAADGLETLAQAEALHPDVVLLDLAMPKLSGLDVLRSLHRDHPECQLLVLTQHDAPDYVLPALQAGARGYLLKRAGGAEVVQAVRAVARGESFLHTAVTHLVIDSVRTGANLTSFPPDGRLSVREREVLALIAEGHTNGEIARVLGISAKTVDKHRASLMEKLGIRTRSGLIRYALQGRGWLAG
jgi:DNA-binding NarL/FixJ family response regulator